MAEVQDHSLRLEIIRNLLCYLQTGKEERDYVMGQNVSHDLLSYIREVDREVVILYGELLDSLLQDEEESLRLGDTEYYLDLLEKCYLSIEP